jgi:hypothetical protein
VFGRGTDFICRTPRVVNNGGVHVLQTFFSEEPSEEYQIMGRTARQGNNGSYRLVILDKELEWLLGVDYMKRITEFKGSVEGIYHHLVKERARQFEVRCNGMELGKESRKKEHESSMKFLKMLRSPNGHEEEIKEFLLSRNIGANFQSTCSKTILLMDATGSMSGAIKQTKETICTMFERARNILREKGLDENCFELKFSAYRNYSSGPQDILQPSSFETDPTKLRSFISDVHSQGGQGNEAIEVGLAFAVNEHEQLVRNGQKLAQVIVIGDMPPNSKNEVKHKRDVNYGYFTGSYTWNGTPFENPTYWEDEIQKLQQMKIPVHAFYITNAAQSIFEEMANRTGGTSAFLPVMEPRGAEILTEFVTKEILRRSVPNKVLGDELVEMYDRRFTAKMHV